MLSKEQELALVARAQQGDESAFTELYNNFRVRLLCSGNHFMREAPDFASAAEELVQDTFINAFRHIHQYKGDARFRTWLYRIMLNQFLMSKRSKRKAWNLRLGQINDVEFKNLTQKGVSDSNLTGVLTRKDLMAALSRLPKGYREIFILHHVHGYEYGEVAKIRGCSIGTTKSQANKARAALRTLLTTSLCACGRKIRHRGRCSSMWTPESKETVKKALTKAAAV